MEQGTLAAIRQWVGSAPDTPDLELRYARLGTVEAVALEVLRGRRADLVASPLSFTVQGDYSQNAADNLKALDRSIDQLETAIGVPGDDTLTIGVLTRCGGC